MTLNTKIGVLRIFGDFELQDTFQEQIALKSIEIDIEKLDMEFSALNVDFNGSSPVSYTHLTLPTNREV